MPRDTDISQGSDLMQSPAKAYMPAQYIMHYVPDIPDTPAETEHSNSTLLIIINLLSAATFQWPRLARTWRRGLRAGCALKVLTLKATTRM